MKRWERIAAAVLLFAGVGGAVEAFGMGYGDLRHPGPGFFPFWLSVLLAFTSFLYFLSCRGKDLKPQPLWTPGTWVRPSIATAVMFLYSFAMGWLGFFSSTFLLFLAWLVIIEREKPLTIGLISVLGTAGLYFVFTVFLKVPLPHGLLF
jgi:putative tricarboxylic transport membrane protein